MLNIKNQILKDKNDNSSLPQNSTNKIQESLDETSFSQYIENLEQNLNQSIKSKNKNNQIESIDSPILNTSKQNIFAEQTNDSPQDNISTAISLDPDLLKNIDFSSPPILNQESELIDYEKLDIPKTKEDESQNDENISPINQENNENLQQENILEPQIYPSSEKQTNQSNTQALSTEEIQENQDLLQSNLAELIQQKNINIEEIKQAKKDLSIIQNIEKIGINSLGKFISIDRKDLTKEKAGQEGKIIKPKDKLLTYLEKLYKRNRIIDMYFEQKSALLKQQQKKRMQDELTPEEREYFSLLVELFNLIKAIEKKEAILEELNKQKQEQEQSVAQDKIELKQLIQENEEILTIQQTIEKIQNKEMDIPPVEYAITRNYFSDNNLNIDNPEDLKKASKLIDVAGKANEKKIINKIEDIKRGKEELENTEKMISTVKNQFNILNSIKDNLADELSKKENSNKNTNLSINTISTDKFSTKFRPNLANSQEQNYKSASLNFTAKETLRKTNQQKDEKTANFFSRDLFNIINK